MPLEPRGASAGRLRFLPVLLLAAALLAGAAPPAGADELSGIFDAQGRTPQGKDYQGAVQIEDFGALHVVLWKLADGEAYKGIGIRMSDILGAAYGPANTRFGLAVYRIRGGTLEGVWADSADLKADLGRETLEGPADLNGEYRITLGQNRDGVTNYSGKVLIRPNGNTRLVIWPTPSQPTVGVGVRVNDLLVVAFGNDPKHLPGVVAYKTGDANSLAGAWAVAGQKTVGTEILTRRPK